MPGECILKFCYFQFVIGETGSYLYNLSGSKTKPIAALTQFYKYRDKDQISRNHQFFEINKLFATKVKSI